MRRCATHLLSVFTAAVLTMLLLGACTNDLKKIQEISAKAANSPVDTTRGVDIIFSDSAKVKARVQTPLMLEYTITKDNKPYTLMPKGVKIIFFDKNHQESGNIIADTAYNYTTTKIIYLRKNVVLTSIKGDVFKSDELTWDMNNHKITSNKPVDIKMANGNVGHGTAMETNEKFDPLTIKNQTGLIYVDRNFDQ